MYESLARIKSNMYRQRVSIFIYLLSDTKRSLNSSKDGKVTKTVAAMENGLIMQSIVNLHLTLMFKLLKSGLTSAMLSL